MSRERSTQHEASRPSTWRASRRAGRSGCSCGGGSGPCRCPEEPERERRSSPKHSLADVHSVFRPDPEAEEEREPRRRGKAQRGEGPAAPGPQSPTGPAAQPPTGSETVWGVPITTRYCRCRNDMVRSARWAARARAAYRACGRRGLPDADAVEACFESALPGSEPDGGTAPEAPAGGLCPIECERDPGRCGYLRYRQCLVHETMHRRACLALHTRFPVAADFDREWEDPQRWADEEVNAYTWDRRFALDVVRALDRICAGGAP